MTDFTTLGELLIDFTPAGEKDGRSLFMQNAGGAVANAAAALAALGGSAAFMGMVGNDQFGRFLKKTLSDKGIDVRGLLMSDEYNTTLAFVHLFENGERDFSFYRKPGADIMYTSAHLDHSLIDETAVFHYGAVSLTDEPVRSALFEAVEYAKSAGKTLSFDPNYRAPLWRSEADAKQQILRALSFADIVKISDNEVQLLYGDVPFEKAAELIVAEGAALVFVTLGSKGAVAACREGSVFVPGFPANAVDATGAGDCFTGSVIARFVKNGKQLSDYSLSDVREMARFSNAAASICVEGRGGISSMPSLAQVQARLRQQ